jgi:molybdopterin-containing oxidoreductase family iron-sulfur binding subunit
MGMDRRKFMKIAGASALGIAGAAGPTENLLAQDTANPDTRQVLEKAPPLHAKRWAMVVDLKTCHEADVCKDCILACNKVHNVPQFDNAKDEVKWIWKESFHHSFHEQDSEYMKKDIAHGPVLLLCNHCDNPPCVRVCPTQATWKREEDGIVMMDWHRCIGCRYCVAACPYGSRSFNWRDPRPFLEEITSEFPTRTRGVVEKCTFCEERLARGQLPACVEACKNNALVFGDLEDPNSAVRELLASNFSIRRKPALGTQPEVYYLV